MESLFEKYKSSQIHYYHSATGINKRVLICFHGYAESAESFFFLEKFIENDFIIIAIDFPFHGETEWNEELLFTPEHLIEILFSIINKLSANNKEIYLFGFSMGARVALDLLMRVPKKLKK